MASSIVLIVACCVMFNITNIEVVDCEHSPIVFSILFNILHCIAIVRHGNYLCLESSLS